MLWTLACALHSLAEQHQSPWSQQSWANSHSSTDKESTAQQIVQPALSVVSQPEKDARGHYWWFHQRMPGGSKEHQPLALYHYESMTVWHWSAPSRKFTFGLLDQCFLADSELIPTMTQNALELGWGGGGGFNRWKVNGIIYQFN